MQKIVFLTIIALLTVWGLSYGQKKDGGIIFDKIEVPVKIDGDTIKLKKILKKMDERVTKLIKKILSFDPVFCECLLENTTPEDRLVLLLLLIGQATIPEKNLPEISKDLKEILQ